MLSICQFKLDRVIEDDFQECLCDCIVFSLHLLGTGFSYVMVKDETIKIQKYFCNHKIAFDSIAQVTKMVVNAQLPQSKKQDHSIFFNK